MTKPTACRRVTSRVAVCTRPVNNSLSPRTERMSRSFEELTPQSFSFNSPLGWCPACQGLGTEQGTNLAALIPNPERSLLEGAVLAWPVPQANPLFRTVLETLSREFEIPLD